MFYLEEKAWARILFITIIILIFGISSYQFHNNEIFAEGWKKFSSVIGIFFTVYSIFIGIVIFFESDNPSKTISWLLVLFLIPVLGFILYIFLGQNIRKKKRFKKKRYTKYTYLEEVANTQRELLEEVELFTNDSSLVKSRLINLLLRNSDSPFTINNRVKVLTNGGATFAEIIRELKKAKHHIHMEYFIIKSDSIGNKIKDILIQKAREGVEVRLIYDSVGCWRLKRDYLDSLREVGVKVKAFYPVVFPVLSRELNYRNHRKIIVIDGKVGFLGGLNIGDEYLGKNRRLGFWRDTHIKVEGEAVYNLQSIFFRDWEFLCNEEIEFRKYFPKLNQYGEKLVQITASGPDSDWESILQAYFTMISTAEKRIWITTPYLVPDESIDMALKTASLTGVDVRIIIPGKPDHPIVYWASRSNI